MVALLPRSGAIPLLRPFPTVINDEGHPEKINSDQAGHGADAINQRSNTMKQIQLAVALFLVILAVPQVQAGVVYDAAADFSPTNNPNGVWSYGWSSTLGSPFNLDVSSTTVDGLNFWEGPVPGVPYVTYPYICHNGTGSTLIYGGAVQMLPGQLAFHPGPQDQYGVIQFTAPTAGTFLLLTSFTGVDFAGAYGPTATSVHVLVDGSSIFSGLVNGFGAGSGPSFDTTLTLKAGDTVDFAVGFGSRDAYYDDATGITATFSSSVPEPSSMVLAVVAGLTLAGYACLCRPTVIACAN
jgi:hypothetical protein